MRASIAIPFRRRAAACILAIGAMLAGPNPARAAQAGAPVAVMGLRLGMTPADALAALRPQARRIDRTTGRCGAARCVAALRARVPDGWLEIRFAPAGTSSPTAREAAWRIRLTIRGAGAADPRQVRAATEAQFGPPAQPSGLLWCPGAAPGSRCPPQGPRLRLTRGTHGARILSLSDPALRGVSAPSGARPPARAG